MGLILTEQDWNKVHGCDHSHCPDGCEHPQPFIYDSQLICGRCYFKCEEVVTMVPCKPETCKDHEPH